MKRGLMREPHTGAMHAWHLLHECGVEAERPGQLRVVLQPLARCGLLVPQRGMQIARRPAKVTVGVGLAGNRRDLIDRGSTGLPKRLGGVVAEGVGQLVEALISDVRQMRGGAAGVTRGDPVPFDQRDPGAFLFEEIRRGDAGEPGPDHHDIHLDVAINGGKIRECVGGRPIRYGIHVSLLSRRRARCVALHDICAHCESAVAVIRTSAAAHGLAACRPAGRLPIDHLTAVGVQDLPRHVGGVIRGEKHITRGDLFGLPGPLQGHVGTKMRHLVLVKR